MRGCASQNWPASRGRMWTGRKGASSQRQLLTGGPDPVFVPTKGKRARSIDLAPETLELLKAHRAAQSDSRCGTDSGIATSGSCLPSRGR